MEVRRICKCKFSFDLIGLACINQRMAFVFSVILCLCYWAWCRLFVFPSLASKSLLGLWNLDSRFKIRANFNLLYAQIIFGVIFVVMFFDQKPKTRKREHIYDEMAIHMDGDNCNVIYLWMCTSSA